MKNMIQQFYSMINQNFNGISNIFSNVKDKRLQHLTIYPKEILIFFVLSMFIFKTRTLPRLYSKIKNFTIILNNFKIFNDSYDIKKIPFYTTAKYFISKVDHIDFYHSLKKMVNILIRKKIFNKFRFLDKYFLVAIDATQQSYTKKPNEKAIKIIHNKGTDKEYITYHYYILSAKIVFFNGFVVPIAAEFIENKEIYSDKLSMKQDCEIKGFYRIAKKIKKSFPRLPICILGDGLYVNQKVFQICEENDWKYIITYKKEKAKSIYDEFKDLKKDKLISKKKVTFSIEEEKKLIKQEISYASKLKYHKSYLDIAEVVQVETKLDKNNNEKKTEQYFMYVTNINLTKDNIFKVINFGGRQRWKIEHSFNDEKNGGYNLEHLHSEDDNIRKTFYYLMLIAKLLNNLYELGILNKKKIKKEFGVLENVSERMFLFFLTTKINTKKNDKINFQFEYGKKYEILEQENFFNTS